MRIRVRQSDLARYALSIAAVFLALAITVALGPDRAGLTPPFFAAVMLSAWFGGLGPGLLATVLAGICSAYFFADPPFSLSIGADDVIREMVFVGVAVLISYLNGLARRRENELLRATADAEAANRAKNHFLAVLSHELRNPLNPALAAATLHEHNLSLPESVRHDMAMIRRNIEMEARLIDDLLDLNRIEHGKLSMHFERADAHELIDEVTVMCRDELATKNIRLVLHKTAEAHWVYGDAARLRQVVWNILKNAAKFTPPDGMVNLVTRNTKTGELELEIRDTGVGIDEEALGRIFNSFDQGDTDVTKRFGGLGLGLSISRYLVEAHGGTIAAASEGKGRGATFVVRLPTIVHDAMTVAPRSHEDGEARSRRMSILLVEDDEDTRGIMARLLRHRHDVCDTGCVKDALDAAKERDFDLVIADLGLPDGSGLDLMSRLKQEHDLPGIALTGYGMQDDQERTRNAGFADHLTKPVDLRRLELVIQRIGGASRRAAATPARPRD